MKCSVSLIIHFQFSSEFHMHIQYAHAITLSERVQVYPEILFGFTLSRINTGMAVSMYLTCIIFTMSKLQEATASSQEIGRT